jgi:hypothetical protein
VFFGRYKTYCWWDAVDGCVRLELWCEADVPDVKIGGNNKLPTDGVVLCACGVLSQQPGVAVPAGVCTAQHQPVFVGHC